MDASGLVPRSRWTPGSSLRHSVETLSESSPPEVGVSAKDLENLIRFETTFRLAVCRAVVASAWRQDVNCALPLVRSEFRCQTTALPKVQYRFFGWAARCRGDRAANVTDCRSVSWGFDSLPRHSRYNSERAVSVKPVPWKSRRRDHPSLWRPADGWPPRSVGWTST